MHTSRSSCLQQSRFADSGVTAAHRQGLRSAHAGHQQRSKAHRCHATTLQIQQDLQQLLNWASSNKAVTDKVTLADDIATDQRVLVAAKDFAAGEQVLAVPDSAWVTPATAQQSSIGKYVSGLEPWLQVALLLLSERARPGGSSNLQPYLSAATAGGSNVSNSPLFWSEEELQLLNGTQLLESVRGYK